MRGSGGLGETDGSPKNICGCSRIKWHFVIPERKLIGPMLLEHLKTPGDGGQYELTPEGSGEVVLGGKGCGVKEKRKGREGAARVRPKQKRLPPAKGA